MYLTNLYELLLRVGLNGNVSKQQSSMLAEKSPSGANNIESQIKHAALLYNTCSISMGTLKPRVRDWWLHDVTTNPERWVPQCTISIIDLHLAFHWVSY